jgi:hypothetical protein
VGGDTWLSKGRRTHSKADDFVWLAKGVEINMGCPIGCEGGDIKDRLRILSGINPGCALVSFKSEKSLREKGDRSN